jgi:hypothetical protein
MVTTLGFRACSKSNYGRNRAPSGARSVAAPCLCTKLRATGMPIRGIRRYAELVAAGPGNEEDRLNLLEAHRADVLARLAEMQESRQGRR